MLLLWVEKITWSFWSFYKKASNVSLLEISQMQKSMLCCPVNQTCFKKKKKEKKKKKKKLFSRQRAEDVGITSSIQLHPLKSSFVGPGKHTPSVFYFWNYIEEYTDCYLSKKKKKQLLKL